MNQTTYNGINYSWREIEGGILILCSQNETGPLNICRACYMFYDVPTAIAVHNAKHYFANFEEELKKVRDHFNRAGKELAQNPKNNEAK